MENKKVKIKDVVKLINGYPFKPTDRGNSGMNIIRIQNLNNPLAIYNKTTKDVDDKYIIKKGDILISWSASLGVYEWKNDSAYLNQHIFKVEFISDNISKDYFRYVIELALEELTYKMHGVGLKHITKGTLENYQFNLPPIDIQNEIVDKLNIVEALIEKRKKTIEFINEYIKSLFYEMFGDPIKNPKKYPKKPLSYFGKWQSGGTPPKSNPIFYTNGVINWFSSGELNAPFISESKQRITEDAIEKTGAKFIKKNSLLIGMYDTAALKTSITTSDSSCNQAIAFSNIIPEKGNNIFILQNILLAKRYFLNMRKGVRQKNLNLSIVKSLEIINPPLSKQNLYSDKFLKVYTQAKQNQQSLSFLEELFQSLLYNSFNQNRIEDDDIDKIMNDELEVETLIQDIKASDFESLTLYNASKDLLFKILERTEMKNKLEKETSKFNKGIVQVYSNNKIENKTNREHKLDSK